MIVGLIWRKEHSPYWDPSITCRKMNFWCFKNTSMKILTKDSFNTLSLQLVFQSYLWRKRIDLYTCVDYHRLNQLTIKNQHLLSLILRLLDQFSHAKVYIKIDLHGTYNLVCIREGDEWKMVLKIHYGHLKTLWCLLALPMHLLSFNIW